MPRAPKSLEPLDLQVAEVLNDLLQESGVSRNSIVVKAGIGNMRGRKIFFAESPAPTIGELSALALAFNTTASTLLAEAEARLAAATEPTPTEEVAEVHTLPVHGRDIPPIPEGLAARRVPSSPVEDEEELPDFSQMAARTVSDEQYQRIMARKKFFDNLGEGADYDPDGWAD